VTKLLDSGARNIPAIPCRRSGSTLIETLAVMTIGSIVVGAAIVLLAGMWRSEQSAENYDGMLKSIVRVAAQFRDDVHQAASVELASGNAQSRTSRFTVTLPGERKIEYQAEPGHITRVVREGDQVKHRESYLLPPSAVAHWEIVSTGGNVMASLLINRPLLVSSIEPSDTRTMRIDAISGLRPQTIAVTQAKNEPSTSN
jgi:hypothetical protein